jgi:hypothetical protein
VVRGPHFYQGVPLVVVGDAVDQRAHRLGNSREVNWSMKDYVGQCTNTQDVLVSRGL